MGNNSFGNVLSFTSWGESHGKAIGCVIEGCPAGLPLTEEDIQKELDLRSPGNLPFTSPRKEPDRVQILSGVFEGETTGMPISLLIFNKTQQSRAYNRDVLKPGHAQFTYLEKYGRFDYRGSGRASARETAVRVAAGSIAKKILRLHDIEILAYIRSIGDIQTEELFDIKKASFVKKSSLFCPDPKAEKDMISYLKKIRKEKDSIGGIVSLISSDLPTGLGDPVYEKLSSNLAKAIFSIPAVKGFEIGSGFASSQMKGSEHNDLFHLQKGKIRTKTNHSGGLLGGITNGMPLKLSVAFKPTPSIFKSQSSLTPDKEKTHFTLPSHAKHDLCPAIRAVPVIEAMTAFVLADALLMNRLSKI